MTQNHDLAHKNARLARVLYAVHDAGRKHWDVSNDELRLMRECSRKGWSVHQTHAYINPEVSLAMFKKHSADHGILYQRGFVWQGRWFSNAEHDAYLRKTQSSGMSYQDWLRYGKHQGEDG